MERSLLDLGDNSELRLREGNYYRKCDCFIFSTRAARNATRFIDGVFSATPLGNSV